MEYRRLGKTGLQLSVNVTTAILGATRDAQLIENLKALDIYPALTLDVMEEIDVIMGNTPVMDEY